MRHEFEPTAFHVTIGSHEPVLRIADGDTVATWCVDAGGRDRSLRADHAGRATRRRARSTSREPSRATRSPCASICCGRTGTRGFTGTLVAPNVVDP